MKTLPKFLLIILVMLSVSCSKENSQEDKMPPYTETGANTFACKVNGKVWVAQTDGLSFADKLQASYSTKLKSMSLYAKRAKDVSNENIGIELKNILSLGEYIVGGNLGNIAYYYTLKPAPEKDYFTDSTTSGKVIIRKLDTINNIYSGIFYFDVKRKTGEGNEEEIIHITEGQFDFKNK